MTRAAWASVAVTAFLAVQLAIPLSYYLRPSRDERFAWRMFSSNQLKPCEHKLYDVFASGEESEVDVRTKLGSSPFGVGLPQLGCPVGIGALLRWRCELARETGATKARFEGTCEGVDGRVSTIFEELECSKP